MVKGVFIAIFAVISIIISTSASVIEYDLMNDTYDVRTVSLRQSGEFMAPPVIAIDSHDRLVLNFDIMGDSHKYLRCRLVHCNYDWEPSNLLDSELVEGFNEIEISDYAYSSNTYEHYVNYNFEFPQSDFKPLVSGNYILQVYPEEDPDDILFEEKFYVSEYRIDIRGVVSGITDKGFNTEYQQLSLEIDLADLSGIDPYRDIIVTVTQNNRPETTKIIKSPSRRTGEKLYYDHEKDLIFDAGNEYRRFETVRADYPGMHVDSVGHSEGVWNAYLSEDGDRVEKEYSFDRTQHGRFMINEYGSSDPNLGADYVNVHFSLAFPELKDGDIYVDGDFSGHTFTDFNKMHYDHKRGLYTACIPLKQGSYNYQYVVAGNSGEAPSPERIEGNFYETSNEYLVNVYLRLPGSRGDRLIGSTVL